MSLQLIKRDAWIPDDLKGKIARIEPHKDIKVLIEACTSYLPPYLAAELVERLAGSVVFESSLKVVHLHGYQSDSPGRRDDYGITSRKVITTAGVVALAVTFNTLTMLNFNFHGLGTSNAAEAVGNTGLTAEITTAYSPDSTRATGAKSNPGSTNTYLTVATNTLDGSAVIEEHGVFSAASGGTLWDRSLTGTQTLASGDGLQTSYTGTWNSGG